MSRERLRRLNRRTDAWFEANPWRLAAVVSLIWAGAAAVRGRWALAMLSWIVVYFGVGLAYEYKGRRRHRSGTHDDEV